MCIRDSPWGKTRTCGSALQFFSSLHRRTFCWNTTHRTGAPAHIVSGCFLWHHTTALLTLVMLMQARILVAATATYRGMPPPPVGQFGNFQMEDALAQFRAGEGGPLATSTSPVNGAYGPPIGAWRSGGMNTGSRAVCHLQLLLTAFLSCLCGCPSEF